MTHRSTRSHGCQWLADWRRSVSWCVPLVALGVVVTIQGFAAEPLPGDALRINQLRLLGTHNSYHIAPDPFVARLIEGAAPAEARAIDRIPDLDDPTQWVTVIDEGEEVDEDALNSWLKARGYQD